MKNKTDEGKIASKAIKKGKVLRGERIFQNLLDRRVMLIFNNSKSKSNLKIRGTELIFISLLRELICFILEIGMLILLCIYTVTVNSQQLAAVPEYSADQEPLTTPLQQHIIVWEFLAPV